MTPETNKALTRHFMERAFNEGDLAIVDGKTSDLWHVWDTAGLMRQLGTAAHPQAV
jgi:hypothetical protein